MKKSCSGTVPFVLAAGCIVLLCTAAGCMGMFSPFMKGAGQPVPGKVSPKDPSQGSDDDSMICHIDGSYIADQEESRTGGYLNQRDYFHSKTSDAAILRGDALCPLAVNRQLHQPIEWTGGVPIPGTFTHDDNSLSEDYADGKLIGRQKIHETAASKGPIYLHTSGWKDNRPVKNVLVRSDDKVEFKKFTETTDDVLIGKTWTLKTDSDTFTRIDSLSKSWWFNPENSTCTWNDDGITYRMKCEDTGHAEFTDSAEGKNQKTWSYRFNLVVTTGGDAPPSVKPSSSVNPEELPSLVPLERVTTEITLVPLVPNGGT